MTMPDYNSPAALKTYLEARGLGMQKKFGQNFLINRYARETLLKALDVSAGQAVWEVGPGLGAETDVLLQTGCNLTAFEIDRGFILALKDIFAGAPNFNLVEGDVLKTWYPYYQSCAPDVRPARFFGNLPYNIAATLIGTFIEKDVRFEKSVVTVQKEVARRMVARPGSDDYSSFSVLCQWAYSTTTVMELSAASFWPRPHVASQAVLMNRREDYPRCADRRLFMTMQRALFATRRKTIKNNLETFLKSRGTAESAVVAAAALSSVGIQPSVRAETLSVDTLLELSDSVYAALQEHGAPVNQGN